MTTMPSRDVDATYAARCLDEIRARWDERADTWDAALKGPGCHLNIDDAYAAFLRFAEHELDSLWAGPVPTLMDLGCGTGLVAGELSRRAQRVVGVDISPAMISVARNRGLANAEFLVGDCFALAIGESSIEAVVSRGVLLSHYGLSHALELLRGIRRVLTTNGVAVIDFLNAGGQGRFGYEPRGKALFSDDDVRELAMAAGFESSRIHGERFARCHFAALFASEPASPPTVMPL